MLTFSGSGKTHTMLGTDKDPGIMVRTLQDLFAAMETDQEENFYKVSMSYLEVVTVHKLYSCNNATILKYPYRYLLQVLPKLT